MIIGYVQRGYNSDLDAEFSQEICLLVSASLFGQLYHLTSHTPAVPKCLLPDHIIMIEIVKNCYIYSKQEKGNTD